jgi:hypothetical protein
LVDIDGVIGRLKIKIRRLDTELSGQIRQMSKTGDKAQRDLFQANQAIMVG